MLNDHSDNRHAIVFEMLDHHPNKGSQAGKMDINARGKRTHPRWTLLPTNHKQQPPGDQYLGGHRDHVFAERSMVDHTLATTQLSTLRTSYD
jgi:hypothetical protein